MLVLQICEIYTEADEPACIDVVVQSSYVSTSATDAVRPVLVKHCDDAS